MTVTVDVALALAALAVPLILGFAGWLAKVGGRVAKLEIDFTGMRDEQQAGEKRLAEATQVLHRIEVRLAGMDEQIKTLFREKPAP